MERPTRFASVNPLLALLALLAVPSLTAQGASHAIDQGGNIYVILANGSRLQITSSAVDSQPDLAPDGTRVVFVRNVNSSTTELWIASVEPGTSARVLLKSPLSINGRKFSQVLAPRFSPDSEAIYFLVPFAATTQAIIKVSIGNPEPQFVAAALNFRVVPVGQYRGDLVAQIRKAKLAPGYYEWYWLLTPEGREIGLVGQDGRDVALFMEQQE